MTEGDTNKPRCYSPEGKFAFGSLKKHRNNDPMFHPTVVVVEWYDGKPGDPASPVFPNGDVPEEIATDEGGVHPYGGCSGHKATDTLDETTVGYASCRINLFSRPAFPEHTEYPKEGTEEALVDGDTPLVCGTEERLVALPVLVVEIFVGPGNTSFLSPEKDILESAIVGEEGLVTDEKAEETETLEEMEERLDREDEPSNCPLVSVLLKGSSHVEKDPTNPYTLAKLLCSMTSLGTSGIGKLCSACSHGEVSGPFDDCTVAAFACLLRTDDGDTSGHVDTKNTTHCFVDMGSVESSSDVERYLEETHTARPDETNSVRVEYHPV